MPYSRLTTDYRNICNISSIEIPPLPQSLVNWLRSLPPSDLSVHELRTKDIDENEVYGRTTLGDYFRSQFFQLVKSLRQAKFEVAVHGGSEVTDIVKCRDGDTYAVVTADGLQRDVETIVIATGHHFPNKDSPEAGYYASPWPIQKILPFNREVHDFEIGILGASLSAFDVATSLAHRHGHFVDEGETVRYEAFDNCPNFRLVMHSSRGWLPHLQYEQDEPIREIYRHTSREELLALRDDQGRLSLSRYFEEVCKPALKRAFERDGRMDIAVSLSGEEMGLEQWIDLLLSDRPGGRPITTMRTEMKVAKRALRKGAPVHWKETLDDLIFTLNYHFDLLSADDIARCREHLFPFLMNVIAAMPLQSAKILLALEDAGRIEVIRGRASVEALDESSTPVSINNGGEVLRRRYSMFVDCTGQGSVPFDDFPFPGLITRGLVAKASANYDRKASPEIAGSQLFKESVDGEAPLDLGGIAIDGFQRVIGDNGEANDSIYCIASPLMGGLRPYSFGLQACSVTAAIIVQHWTTTLHSASNCPATIEEVSLVYDGLEEKPTS